METPSVLERHPANTPEEHFTPGPERPKRRFRWVWLVVLAGVAYGAYRGYQFESQRQADAAALAAARSAHQTISVLVTPAHLGNMPVELQSLGTVTAFQTVTVKTRIDGQLTHIAFREGQFVNRGDLLAEIDPRPYQVQLEQAEGQLARDEAQLNDAQANLNRYKALFADQVIAKQQLDTQASMVAQFGGAIQADQAQINNAKLQLTYCKITAPLSGRVGLRQVDAGNIVHASDPNGIVVITQLQPIAVLFSIPEDNLQAVLGRLRSGATLPVDAYDRNGAKKLATGTLLTVDNQIDPNTGTSKLKAVFNNSGSTLFPNQFVNIRLLLQTKRDALIIPAAALQTGPQGAYVYVVTDTTAHVRPVAVGITQGTNISIEEGLKAGDEVVIDGADKLTEGMKVEVRKPEANEILKGSHA
jgi:multidrug efflux system membrane fusion protein